MEIPHFFEQWSWVAGVASTALAAVGVGIATRALLLQARSARREAAHSGDLRIMDKTFHGVRIGAPAATLLNLRFEQVARDGQGATKISKWRLDDGNDISATYDTERDRILYVEVDWNGNEAAERVGIDGLKFGKTTLQEIRELFGSNGFSYVDHMMFNTVRDIVTFNAFELVDTPSIVVVFITKIPDVKDLARRLNAGGREEQLGISDQFILVSVAVADEPYLDKIWGTKKIYDPASRPIKLGLR